VSPIRRVFGRWTEVLCKLEDGILISFLLIMVGLAFVQILLRLLFSSGMIWGDVALRHLVLWVGLLGATVATRESRHINIDILPRLLTGRAKAVLAVLIDFFCTLVALILTRAGFTFMRDEFLSGTTTFLQIPSWIVAVIFPLAFLVITIHFGLNGLTKILDPGKPSP